jgi:hypothetical protein
MVTSSESVAAVREVLRAFNEGYIKRDLSAVDAFMKLFVDEDELEVVGLVATHTPAYALAPTTE